MLLLQLISLILLFPLNFFQQHDNSRLCALQLQTTCRLSDTIHSPYWSPVWCCESGQTCGRTFGECKNVSARSAYTSVVIGILISCICTAWCIISRMRWIDRQNQLAINSTYQPVAIINSTTIHLAEDELPPSYEQAISDHNQHLSPPCR